MSVHASSVTDPSAQEASEATVLAHLAYSAIALGHWPEAAAAAEECLALADPVHEADQVARGWAAAGIVAAVRGDGPTARALLTRCEDTATRRGASGLLDVVQLGRGIEALSAGRYDEAWARLRWMVDAASVSSPWVRLVGVGYLAEAGLRCGIEPAAAAVLAAVEGLAPLESAAALPGATAYARVVVRRDVGDDTTYARALAECPADRAFDRARIHLARGVHLRRDRRVTESRLPLHEALVVFERLGATPWADQARGELRATGERRHHRELGDVEELTAQELQIARMAARGLTNREIGRRLYLSHRTIGSHLYRAFPKLGIAARSQLRDVLADIVDLDRTLDQVAR